MNTKLVILSFDGSIESKLKVSIQIREEQGTAFIRETGYLPSNPQLIAKYSEWQRTYLALEAQTRAIKAKSARIDDSTAVLRRNCRLISDDLKYLMSAWLNHPDFNPIRRAFHQEVLKLDNARVLIQSDEIQIWRLPWHLWDEIEGYSNLEFGFSRLNYHKPEKHNQSSTEKVQILAVFGDDQGINLNPDQIELQQTSTVEINFLYQPSRQEFSDKLWNNSWDILFFAGHSHTTDTKGYIQLNKADSLDIAELKHSLRHAINNGLQLAIFNSCDGLGLAWELGELNIPQIILMREKVPDVVAQTFLRYFLQGYSTGTPLYTAVRQARDRLESLEKTFPCATWLPVIYQHPALSPTSWSTLRQTVPPSLPLRKRLLLTFGLSLSITAVILSLRFLGFFQFFELKLYDVFISLAPRNPQPDPRFLLIQITEEDLNLPEQRDRIDSLSSQALNRLMVILNKAGAKVVGLDIYRDRQLSQEVSENLSQWANTSSPLVTICRVKDTEKLTSEVSPPPHFPIDSVGFSDQITDPDGVIRRALLVMKPEVGRCIVPYAFSVQLALRYLASQDNSSVKSLQFVHKTGAWQLGRSTFNPLQLHQGAYHSIDDRGIQVFLGYRLTQGSSSLNSFETVTLSQVLNGSIAEKAIENRIILIGTTAESYKDFHQTPIAQDISGLMLQAHITSYLIDVALGHRSLIWVWNVWIDSAWVAIWVLGGVIIVFSSSTKTFRYASLGFTVLLLGGFSWGMFSIIGVWLPFFPNLLGLIIIGILLPKLP
jgi:CHASE2 domain-containing sensor protein